MRSVPFSTIQELDELLARRQYWANGKNCRIDHLHATGAQSRFERENIHGIYLTNENHAWMAFWMAATDRTALRKRSLLYVRPSYDAIGELRIAGPLALREEAYLYLFEPLALPVLDIRDRGPVGFSLRSIVRHGQEQRNYVAATPEPTVVLVDEWQLALVNVPRVTPDLEVILTKPLLEEARKRVGSVDAVGEEYVVDACAAQRLRSTESL